MNINEEASISEEDVMEVIDIDQENDNESIDSSSSLSSKEEISEDEICVFRGHQRASVFCGSLNYDGKLAITGSEEDIAYLWDTTTGNITFKCTGHQDSVIFAEFNFNGTFFATGDMKGIIKLWRLNDTSLVWSYDMGDAVWMKWHHSANVLLAGAVKGDVYMWKLPEGQCKVFSVQVPGYRTECSVLFTDGRRLAVGYEDGMIRVIDLKESNILSTVTRNLGHSNVVTAIDYYTDHNLLISGSMDGKTILTRASDGKLVSILQNLIFECKEPKSQEELHEDPKNWVETVAFCKNVTFPTAVTATINGEIFIWNIAKQTLRHKIDLKIETGISKILWKGHTTIILAAGLDGVMRCIDGKTGECLRLYKGHKAPILDLCISLDEKKVLTVSDDSTARIFDISSVH